jgi:hypothetical protein
MPPRKIPKIEVGKCIRSNLHFIKNLAQNSKNPNQIINLIKTAKSEQLLALVEIALNLLRSRIPSIGRSKLRRLTHRADQIRRLSRTHSPQSARKVLLQSGKGLPVIAGILASTILPILVENIAKKFK